MCKVYVLLHLSIFVCVEAEQMYKSSCVFQDSKPLIAECTGSTSEALVETKNPETPISLN